MERVRPLRAPAGAQAARASVDPEVERFMNCMAHRTGRTALRASLVRWLLAALASAAAGAAWSQPDGPLVQAQAQAQAQGQSQSQSQAQTIPAPPPYLLAAAPPEAAAPGLPPPPPAPPPAPERDLQQEARRGYWRSLSPEQREAIRRLSQEQREALANRSRSREGGVVPPGGRLTPEERRQLRAQIREERERRGGRFGPGRRP